MSMAVPLPGRNPMRGEYNLPRKKVLGQEQPIDGLANLQLPTQGEDDYNSVLRGMAGQINQPFRSGWAALTGIPASVFGGMAAQKLRENQSVDPERQLNFEMNKARLAQMQQQKQPLDPLADFKTRQAQLAAVGGDPASPEGKRFLLTGSYSQEADASLPASVKEYEYAKANGFTGTYLDFKADKGKTVTQQSNYEQNISGGINRLAQVPNDYSESNLRNSIGTIQGDDNSVLAPIARLWGSLTADPVSPTQIRARIAGDVEALAAAIKPLIRKPGEGAWTDADQQRLVSIVGNLTLANNSEEYKQALEVVRQRVMSNFGLQLPPINFGGQQEGQQPQQSQQAARPQSQQEWQQLPPGTQYIAPDGQMRIKQ